MKSVSKYSESGDNTLLKTVCGSNLLKYFFLRHRHDSYVKMWVSLRFPVPFSLSVVRRIKKYLVTFNSLGVQRGFKKKTFVRRSKKYFDCSIVIQSILGVKMKMRGKINSIYKKKKFSGLSVKKKKHEKINTNITNAFRVFISFDNNENRCAIVLSSNK